jgi:uncharacterized protein
LAHQYPITIDFARTLYENGGGGHDFDHVLRVTALAERIAAAEGADVRVVRTAALLHDIAENEGREDHHLRGAAKARALLQGEPEAFVAAVAHAIEAHRFRAEPAPATLAAQCLSDADKLDAIGAIGVARAYAYAGAHDTALWKLTWQAIANGQGDAVRSPDALGEDYTPVHEFVYKLDRIPDRLYTATARAIAAERQRFMRAFFDRLDEEVVGKA